MVIERGREGEERGREGGRGGREGERGEGERGGLTLKAVTNLRRMGKTVLG